MNLQHAAAVFGVFVALSLIGAPVTMGDWSEQATLSVEHIDKSEVDSETPVLHYENLSASAQHAVRRAIESPDGDYTVYGHEDWPDRFFYSDYTAPGQGLYAIVYEGQYYRLRTYAGGGFPFVYWLFESPFILYGFGLVWLAQRTYRGEYSGQPIAVASALGVSFHLLGPEFDFPLLAPMQFVGLGMLATVGLGIALATNWLGHREETGTD